jgi:hypothetical protein
LRGAFALPARTASPSRADSSTAASSFRSANGVAMVEMNRRWRVDWCALDKCQKGPRE